MKHILLIVGDSIKTNDLLLQYIFRTYKNHFFNLSNVLFSSKSDIDLPFLLEKLSQQYKQLTIFAHKDSFTLINKILSTLTQDSLSLKEGILLPSKVKIYEKNSYLLEIGNCTINTLHVNENESLGNILHVKNTSYAFLNLIGIDEESSNILFNSTKEAFGINTITTTIVPGWTRIEARANMYQNIDHFCNNIKQLFKNKIFISENPIEFIVNSLIKHHKTISIAESCTGGLISSLITSIPNSSQIFEGSLITYANRIKNSWLGVDDDILQTHGAVSEATIKQMLDGTLKTSNCDIALATSGIAGPSGSTKDKPVGTVFIGIANKEGKFLVERLYLNGDRNYIQMQSAFSAFRMLFDLEPKIFFSK